MCAYKQSFSLYITANFGNMGSYMMMLDFNLAGGRGLIVLAVGLVLGASSAHAQTTNRMPLPPEAPPSLLRSVPANLPGPRPDGSVLLPNQWSLRPAGRQVDLGDFPVNIAVQPSGRFAAIVHSGFAAHQILVVDLNAAKVVCRQPVHETFYGVEFSHSGRHLYCSGASDEVVHCFDFQDGQLRPAQDLRLRPAAQRGIPCGLAVSPDERTLFAANLWGQSVSQVDLLAHTNYADLLLGPHAVAPAPTFTGSKSVDPDLAAITKRADAVADPTTPDAPFPYACRLDAKHQRLYVSLWAQARVAVVDLNSREIIAHWPAGEHPNEMLLTKSGRLLYVANANVNTVTLIDTVTGQTMETLDASLYPGALPGSTPNSVALSPDETKLFVANACNNNVAVFDVSAVGKSRSLGFIPVGWYPTSVRVTPNGRHLLVANGKGLSSQANPKGPQPGRSRNASTQSIKDLFPGTLSIIDLAKGKDFATQMSDFTAQVYRCTPPGSGAGPPQATGSGVAPSPSRPGRSPDNPVPAQAGQPSPIKYCIYVIKENRTYDQILGDLPQGNGDASLCLFPERVTPNFHKLAREFVLLDNFYVDAEVSADGHEWSMGAYANDFVEKTWPLNYGHPHSKKFPYPAEGNFPIAFPASGYLWDRAREAGVGYRSYGEFVAAGKTAKDPVHTRVASLQDHFDPWFHGFDTSYPDIKRAERFLEELKRFETEGDMPRLQIVRLPNDHTAGALPGRLTPTAYVADNDRALGMLVEGVSRSKFWPQTAVFVLEDDAQDGPDHVDAHRSPAFVLSPFTRRGGVVDSTMYSTSSLLRTIELILGLQPMTQFDSAATPMFSTFQSTPDTRPYEALPANVDLKARNTLLSWGSTASQRMDFTREDAADDHLLNEIVWRSVRGPNHPMPAPVHAAFVFQPPRDNDGD